MMIQRTITTVGVDRLEEPKSNPSESGEEVQDGKAREPHKPEEAV